MNGEDSLGIRRPNKLALHTELLCQSFCIAQSTHLSNKSNMGQIHRDEGKEKNLSIFQKTRNYFDFYILDLTSLPESLT